MEEVYLDNAATTRVYSEAAQLALKIMREDYGNPSSLHRKGMEAERYLRYARQTLAGILKADEKELVFTSCGSESNNLALIGAAEANARAGRHILSTRIEHPSVYNPLAWLEEQGFETEYLPVDHHGMVRLDALEKAIRPDTILVSVMAVNNEIGTIQPLENVVRIVKEKNPDTLIHVDAIQGFGKLHIFPGRLGIDLMSASGHKIHGPKGTGFLWIREGTKVHPLMLGGGQQKGRRSGTENVPGYAAMAKAAEIEFTDFDEKLDRLYALRKHFIGRMLAEVPGTVVNGGMERGSLKKPEEGHETACAAPHVVSVSFDDVRAEVLLHALEDKNIFVSSGSACSSNHPQLSGTLKAVGVGRKYLDATLRFSFSFETTQEELDYTIDTLKELLPMLRRFRRH